MDIQINTPQKNSGNVVATDQAATVANTVAAVESGKTLASVLGSPSLTVTENDLIDQYFEPLKKTAENLAPSEKQEELKERQKEEDLKAEQEQELLEKQLLQKEMEEERASQAAALV